MKEKLNWLVKGLAMGAADVVPGVSGGTLAFILGVYERFLAALTAINLTAVNLLRRGRWRTFWQHIDGTFLTILFTGILISIFSLAGIINHLLEHRPVPLWALFNGLILGALPYLLQPIRFTPKRIMLLCVGIAFAASISFLTPIQTTPATWLFFFAGFIAICAMLIPGISGTFLLLLMGMYAPVVAAVSDMNITILVVFASGCALGLLLLSRVLSALLQRFQDSMLALLCGVVIGAFVRLWPWQLDSELMSPARYAEIMGHTDVIWAIVCLVVGFSLIKGLRYFEKMLGKNPEQEVEIAEKAAD